MAAVVGMITLASSGHAQQSHFHGKMSQRFAEMDLNGDGAVTADEIRQKRTVLFAESDSDGNGALSLSELEAMIERRRQAQLKKRLQRMDSNGDGIVSQSEFASKGGKWLQHLDSDGNGRITMDEAKQLHRRHHPGKRRFNREHRDMGQKGM